MGCLRPSEVGSFVVFIPPRKGVLWLKGVGFAGGAYSSFQGLWFCTWDFLFFITNEIVVFRFGSLDIFSLQGVVWP
jgi:hypothetical protein